MVSDGTTESGLRAGKEGEPMEGKGLARGLGAQQQAVLEMLVVGKTIAETARSSGISRTTIYQWMKHDPVFQAAHNRWQEHLKQTARSRLLMLTEKATDALQNALEKGDARTALQLLKGLGLMREMPTGRTDAGEIKESMEVEKRSRKANLEFEKKTVAWEEADAGMG